MLDIQFIRDNPALVADKSRQKGCEVDISGLLALDARRRQLLPQVDELRKQRNQQANELKNQKPSDKQIAKGKHLKEELSAKEAELNQVDQEYHQQLRAVPNMPLDGVPVGTSESDNVVAKQIGEPTNFDFTPKSHEELATAKDWLDKERAAKIAGSRFAYLKGDLARLQFALINFTTAALGDEKLIKKLIDENGLTLVAKPFTLVLPPALLRTEPYAASARLNAEEVTYKLADDDLWLNASAEHTLSTMYWKEVLPAEQLPIRLLGYSTSFRREAGTYGKDTEGIFRMHQFDKLEMETISTAETGLDEHLLQVSVQEYLVQQLGLPYQLLEKCTADIGKPNARGIDINCWFPAQGKYRETHTADYLTDYQARGLQIRARAEAGEVKLVHTNDATAFALGRTLAALLENNQTNDGRVVIPEVLRPYLNDQDEL